MRIHLQHKPTGQYFQSLEKWTKSLKKAHDFRFIDRAMRFASKAGFQDMELILSFDYPEALQSRFESRASVCIPALD